MRERFLRSLALATAITVGAIGLDFSVAFAGGEIDPTVHRGLYNININTTDQEYLVLSRTGSIIPFTGSIGRELGINKLSQRGCEIIDIRRDFDDMAWVKVKSTNCLTIYD